jgi:hypothetical protein
MKGTIEVNDVSSSTAEVEVEAPPAHLHSAGRRPSLRAEDLIGLSQRLKAVTVNDPEDGSEFGTVYIRPISAGQMIDFMKEHKRDEYAAGLKLIAAAVVDENGELLFTEQQARWIPFKTFGVLQGAVQDALGLGAAGNEGEEGAEDPSRAMAESGDSSSIA